MRGAILAAGALLFAAPANAAQWEYVTTSSSGALVYFDASNLKQEGDVITTWMKSDYSRVKSEPLRSMLSHVSIRCADRESGTSAWVKYNAAGGVAASWAALNGWVSYQAIIPESVMEIVHDRLCGV